jgi:hypothetical protein
MDLFLCEMNSRVFEPSAPVYSDYEAAVALCWLFIKYQRYTLWKDLQPFRSSFGRWLNNSGLKRTKHRLSCVRKVNTEKEENRRKVELLQPRGARSKDYESVEAFIRTGLSVARNVADQICDSYSRAGLEPLDFYHALPQTAVTQNWRDYTHEPCYIRAPGARDGVLPPGFWDGCDTVPRLGAAPNVLSKEQIYTDRIPDDYVVGRYPIPNRERLTDKNLFGKYSDEIPMTSTIYTSNSITTPNDVYIASPEWGFESYMELAEVIVCDPLTREIEHPNYAWTVPDVEDIEIIRPRRVPGAPRLRPRIRKRYRRVKLRLHNFVTSKDQLIGDEDLDLISF